MNNANRAGDREAQLIDLLDNELSLFGARALNALDSNHPTSLPQQAAALVHSLHVAHVCFKELALVLPKIRARCPALSVLHCNNSAFKYYLGLKA